MTTDQTPTEAAPVLDYPDTAETPLAYAKSDEGRPLESYDSPASKLPAWGIPVAAVMFSLALLVLALTHWVTATHGASPSVVWAPAPTITSTPVPVSAPDKDTAFLMDLDKQGVWSLSSYAAIHDAGVVCRSISIGQLSQDDIAAGLIDAHIAGKGMTDRAAVDKFISVATQHYCPQVRT